MIHVAIMCARNSAAMGRTCPAIQGETTPAELDSWYATALAEHAWTVDDEGNEWCPLHNPADLGAPVEVVSGEYRPLGDSGWEARLPESYSVMEKAVARIEIRQQRRGEDD